MEERFGKRKLFVNMSLIVLFGLLNCLCAQPEWVRSNICPSPVKSISCAGFYSNQFYAIGFIDSVQMLFSSSNGKVWTNRVLGLNIPVKHFAAGNNSYVAIIDTSTDYYFPKPQVFVSLNGTTWKTVLAPSYPRLFIKSLIYADNKFIITCDSVSRFGSSYGRLLLSSDGTTWENRATASGALDPIWKIAWNGSLFVGVGPMGTILSSPNCTSWTDRSPGYSEYIYDVCWGGGRFIALSDYRILSSTDGVSWISTSDTKGLVKIAFGDGVFIAIRYQWDGYWTDNSNWNLFQILPRNTDFYESVVFGNHKFIIFCDNGAIYVSERPTSIIPSPIKNNDVSKISVINNVLGFTCSLKPFVTVSLFDIRGRLLRKLVHFPQAPGQYSVSLPPGLSAGTYIISFCAGEQRVDKLVPIGIGQQ
jgi:hypothetical protein